MRPVYLLIGCPTTGKSWVAEQLGDSVHYVPHDQLIADPNRSEYTQEYVWRNKYIDKIAAQANTATKPVLAETPFSIEQIRQPLAKRAIPVHPVYIQEDRTTLDERHQKRKGVPLPDRYWRQQKTYAERADATGAFQGTSSEVRDYLAKRVK